MTDKRSAGSNDCCSDFDPSSMPLEQARERILAQCPPLTGWASRPIRDALGQVLAEDVSAPVDVPPYRNSAMDGYAVRAGDLAAAGDTHLELVGRSLAGHPFAGNLGPGQAIRIMTGAVVPDGADTIVMQENCTALGEAAVRIHGAHSSGQHLRHPGDDIRRGQTVLSRGRVLKAADIGLLASIGVRQVKTGRNPRVAYFSTGDELTGVGSALAPGQIYDSNRYTLHAMLVEAQCDPIDLGVVRDERQALEAMFDEAAANADVVITTGGVSVGDADYVKEVLEQRGQVDFWKIAMKPGRPLTFGHINDALFFGLPGNPVSVMATFYQLVLPALRRLRGQREVQPISFSVPTVNELRKQAGRIEFQRGILSQRDGRLVVESTGHQDSHILSSMSRADCFIVLPSESTGAAAGDMVEVQIFATR